MSKEQVVLQAQHLIKQYPVKNSSLFHREKQFVHAVDDISFDLMEGQTLGLVGESGCGKSTVGRLLTGIEQPTQGEVFYRGKKLDEMTSAERRKIRMNLQMIFQDPYAALNPKKRVWDILADPIVAHGLASRRDAGERIDTLLEEVGLPRSARTRYPHEFSGGQRQRIVIARALSLNPDVIICDEPVSALDNSIQAQILNLLKELQQQRKVTYLFIAHGLGAVRYVSTRVAVMYLGKIVEVAPTKEIFRAPLHPYTQMLISSVPVPDPSIRERKALIPVGEVPSAIIIPSGCRFHDRCPFATAECAVQEPPLSVCPEEETIPPITGGTKVMAEADGAAGLSLQKQEEAGQRWQHMVACHHPAAIAQRIAGVAAK